MTRILNTRKIIYRSYCSNFPTPCYYSIFFLGFEGGIDGYKQVYDGSQIRRCLTVPPAASALDVKIRTLLIAQGLMVYLLKFCIVSIAIVVMATTTALAQSSSESQSAASEHHQNVEDMLELLGMPEQVNKATHEVIKLYAAKVEEGNTDPDLQRLVDAYQVSLYKTINSVLNWNSMKPNYINVYAKRFDEDDVAAINGFLISPTGRRFVSGQADATAEIQQITKHIVEADMTEPLTLLANQLREGLTKIQAAKQAE